MVGVGDVVGGLADEANEAPDEGTGQDGAWFTWRGYQERSATYFQSKGSFIPVASATKLPERAPDAPLTYAFSLSGVSVFCIARSMVALEATASSQAQSVPLCGDPTYPSTTSREVHN